MGYYRECETDAAGVVLCVSGSFGVEPFVPRGLMGIDGVAATRVDHASLQA